MRQKYRAGPIRLSDWRLIPASTCTLSTDTSEIGGEMSLGTKCQISIESAVENKEEHGKSSSRMGMGGGSRST